MSKYRYWTLILLFLMSSGICCAQKEDSVIYHNYTRQSLDLLDSLRRGDFISSFKGIQTLRAESRDVKKSTRIRLNMSDMGKEAIKPADMIEQRRSSVLILCKYLALEGNREAVSMDATATVLSDDGICVTNYHVLQALIDESIKIPGKDSIYFVATEAGKVFAISEILTYNDVADLLIFKVDTRGEKLSPIPIGHDLRVGENVHTLTHPGGYLYTYTQGLVSRTIKKHSSDPFSNRMEITADYARGSSGGPIMDDYGNLIGLVSSIYSIYYIPNPPTHQQINIKEVVPVSSILRLVQ